MLCKIVNHLLSQLLINPHLQIHIDNMRAVINYKHPLVNLTHLNGICISMKGCKQIISQGGLRNIYNVLLTTLTQNQY